MDIGSVTKVYGQGIELRFMTYSDDHYLIKLNEAHLINGLHETFFLEHVIADIENDGIDELVLLLMAHFFPMFLFQGTSMVEISLL